MYSKILVPLDGSELAECVLPHVEAIARGCEVKNVLFVRVVEPFTYSGGEYVPSVEDTKHFDAAHRTFAEDYLKQLVSRVKYDGVKVESEVIMGKIADSLADYAREKNVDLIILATHGRSGISRWVWGSVADRLLRSACTPILMVRAPGCVPGI